MIVALPAAATLLAVGWALRRAVPARGALLAIVPAAIFGGLVALLLRLAGGLPGSVDGWQDAAYHLFGISFLAIGLTPTGDAKLRKGALWMGIGQWSTFALQAAAGGLAMLALGSAHDGFGFLAPMGLNEGPGQALSIGRLWEDDYGFANAASIGATIASIGFLVAYGGGLLAVRNRHRGVGSLPSLGRWSRATVAWALALAVGYTLLYQLVFHGFGLIGEDLRDLVLAVMFFVALLAGMAVRVLLSRRGSVIDGDQTRTVAMVAVDWLTVAILGSLTWEAISGVAAELVAVIAGAVVATVAVLWVARRWIDQWRQERALALFGTVTGTAASGLALLALVDPELESPVSAELGAMVVVSAPAVLGGIALATAAASGAVSVALATAVFAVVGIASLAVLAAVMGRVAE